MIRGKTEEWEIYNLTECVTEIEKREIMDASEGFPRDRGRKFMIVVQIDV